MSNRHLARTIAMQTLYEWDFLGKPEKSLKEMLAYNAAEFAPDFDDHGFAEELADGVRTHQKEIDPVLQKYAPEWPIDQITIVDRNILRLGIYELLFAEHIPSKVAINEAIELAKAFGGESSGRFVNGVLGAMFRDRVAQGHVKKIDQEQREKAEAAKAEAAQKPPSQSA